MDDVDEYEREDRKVKAVHEELVASGALAAVGPGAAEQRGWLDCDYASLAENRLGDGTDPRHLDPARRADWKARAMEEPLRLPSAHHYERCYWIMEGGERAGTISIATSTLGGRLLRIASFYVYPPLRGHGVGRRTLGRLEEALGRQGLGLRLDTYWSWQKAVRFYLDIGMWLHMWKHDLTFRWDPRTPSPRIVVDDRASTASLAVPLGGTDVVLARARREGERLILDDAPEEDDLAKDKRIGEAYWHATSTLSVALALHGWPLIRSPEHWEQCHYADGGPPEALAYKIPIWEAWDRKHGWNVETTRIPGLDYPTWEALEARWKAEEDRYLKGEKT